MFFPEYYGLTSQQALLVDSFLIQMSLSEKIYGKVEGYMAPAKNVLAF